jgi:Tol biopolymer transport system component
MYAITARSPFSRGSGAIATVQTTSLGSIQVGPAERPDEARELPGRLSDRDGGAGLSWLNDRELVFSRANPVPSLWMRNADGTGERRLAEGVVAMQPRASRDGQTVLFEGLRQPGDFPEIFRLTLPDGRVTQVTREKGAVNGTLSADGRNVFFRRSDEKPPNQLLGMALDGGGATSVYEAPGIFDFALSPDGTRFAVITNSGVGTPRTVNLLAATGGAARTIFTTGGTLDYVRWYPSGDALLLRIGENRQWNIFRLDLAGGAPRQLTHVTRGFVIYPEISPDGRRIAYFRGTSEPDIVLLKPKGQ